MLVVSLRGVNLTYSLQAGSSVENGARSKYKPLYFDRAPFSTEEPACRLVSLRANLHGTTLSHATTAYDRPTT